MLRVLTAIQRSLMMWVKSIGMWTYKIEMKAGLKQHINEINEVKIGDDK
jgi:hypothetical protein